MSFTKTRTKIIATMGPAVAKKDILKSIILEGVNIIRINFSHGSHEEHLKEIELVREVNKELNTNIAILADLQGPKLRIGEVENNAILLNDGDEVFFVTEKCMGTKEHLYMTYQEFPRDVKVGEFVLVDDGKIKLEVVETNGKDKVKAKVVYGGVLSSKKGVNLPNTKVSLPSLTEKDRLDAEFALDHDVDWIALSFVRTVTDVVDLQKINKQKKKHAWVISKIEKPEALEEIDNIIDMSQGVMIARGDLGVEVPYDQVPLIQKNIIKKCIAQSKPVIVATQMMESMITNFRPTRAEATDVANAVIDGADTLMLSGETSVGKYPVDTIKAMHSIINWTEDNAFKFNLNHAPLEFTHTFLADSICYNAAVMAEQSGAKAIITFTYSGYTAFRISSHRPKAETFVFTSNSCLINKMSLLWGVKSFFFDKYENIDDAVQLSISILKEKGLLKDGDIVVHVGSTPLHEKGQTNMLKLSIVKLS
jgi:pyruvate kinase